jgi:transposase InsO family protein
MISTTRQRHTYDHRLRDLVRSTGNIEHATRRGIPRSTARGWLSAQHARMVTLDVLDQDRVRLQKEVLALRRGRQRLLALLRLMVVLWKVSGFSLSGLRFPDQASRLRLLQAIDRAQAVLPLRAVLRIIGLSRSRYHAWKRDPPCGLDDVVICPRSAPQQLTPSECTAIKEMVTSEEYRHVPTATLARLAQRLGKVFASPTTWYRLVHRFQWRRPRRRIHPSGPKVGIRASRPDQIWHIDTTVIRLLDGSRAYLRAIIDNFSRRILAWQVSATFDPGVTAALLHQAVSGLSGEKPTLLADAGVENCNGAVDRLVDSGLLKRLVAMTEISFSNSLIESWWRALKHQWLYLNTLDTVATLERLVGFYVAEHNTRLPHSAFRGQTPDEMYFGTGEHVPGELEMARQAARRARLETNRKMSCPQCEPLTVLAN